MSQKLSRTINLPKAPASFTDEQRRYFDDIARSLTDQFRDLFDLLGEDAGSLEKHMGDVTAHKMSEGNVASVGVIRSAEGKVRFTGSDGTELTDDYGVTFGAVSPAIQHIIDKTLGVHGSTASPAEGKIAAYSGGGRLKGAAPVDDDDLVPKSTMDEATASSDTPLSGRLAKYAAGGKLRSAAPDSGNDVVNYDFLHSVVGNAIAPTRFVLKDGVATAAGNSIAFNTIIQPEGMDRYNSKYNTLFLTAGIWLIIVRLPAWNSIYNAHFIFGGLLSHSILVATGDQCYCMTQVIDDDNPLLLFKPTTDMPAMTAGQAVEVIFLGAAT